MEGTTQHAVSERVGNLVDRFQTKQTHNGGHGAAELRELTALNQRLLEELAAKAAPRVKPRGLPWAPEPKAKVRSAAASGRETPWAKKAQARAVLSPYQEVVAQTSG